MSYENLVAKGDPEVGGRNLDLLLYPNEKKDGDRDRARNEIWPALETACDQLLNSNALEYYEINLCNDETNCEYIEGEPKGSTYFNNFQNYIDNNHGTRRGVHLGVTDHTNYAEGEHVGKGDTAWVATTKAFVGTAGGYDVNADDKERYKNLSVQEPLHNMISSEYSAVNDMTNGDEHDLGKITSSYGPSTPMLTFYERKDTHPNREHDRSEQGECQTKDATWAETHTRTLTNCTEDAVYWTSQYET
jgi:hypothetical protein